MWIKFHHALLIISNWSAIWLKKWNNNKLLQVVQKFKKKTRTGGHSPSAGFPVPIGASSLQQRVILFSCSSVHITFLFKTLQWFSVALRMRCKLFKLPTKSNRTLHTSRLAPSPLPSQLQSHGLSHTSPPVHQPPESWSQAQQLCVKAPSPQMWCY